MTAFKNRPTAFFAAVFVISCIVLIGTDTGSKPIIIAAAAAAAIMYTVAFFVIPKKSLHKEKNVPLAFVASALAVLFAAVLMYLTVDRQLMTAASLVGTDARIEALITEIKSETVYSGSYTADILTVDGEDVTLTARFETEFSSDLAVGDVISVQVMFEELTDDGAYDLKTNGFRRGVTVLAVSEDAESLSVTGHRDDVLSALEAVQKRISAVLSVSSELSGGDCGLMQTLFIGDRTELDGVVRRDFTYAGISHLLAVSGMHLSIVIGGFEALLKKLTLHKTPRTLILIAVTLLYMGLTGFSASVLRAGLMLILYQISYFSGREADRITSLFLAVGLIILISPFSASDVGLLLSFSAMLACIAADETVSKRADTALSRMSAKGNFMRLVSYVFRFILHSLSVSLYASVFTLPVMWLHFGRISLLAPLGTLMLSLPVTAILYLTPFVFLTFRVPWLWAVFAYPCAWICRLSASLAAALAKIRNAELLLPSEDAVTAIALCVIVVCVTCLILLPKRYAAVSGCVAVAVAAAIAISSVHYRQTYDKNTVFYLNNNKNEGFVIADGADALVVDISNGGSYITSAAVEIAREELRADVNAYMLTHLHRRHIKTTKKLLESEYIDRLILPAPADADETAIYNELSALAEKYGAETYAYIPGTEFAYGDIMIDTAAAYIDRSVHPTVILAFESEGTRSAYIGSSVHESELFSLALDICRNSEEVIFGIHGSIPKSGADYLLTDSQRVTYASEELEALFTEMKNDKN